MRKVVLLLMPLFLAHVTEEEKNLPSAKPASNQVIFAVLYDGEGIEPIASLANGKLSHPSALGEGDAATQKSFLMNFTSPKRHTIMFTSETQENGSKPLKPIIIIERSESSS